jgi:hypothetical protein
MAVEANSPWARRILSAINRKEDWFEHAREVANHFEGVDEEGVELRHFYNKHLAADRNMIAALTPRRLEVEATTDRPDESAFHRVMEMAVKHNFTRARIIETLREFVYWGFEWGVGIMYVAWGKQGQLNPTESPEGQPTIGKPTERRVNPTEDPSPQAQEAINRAFVEPGVGEDWVKYFAIPPTDYVQDPTVRTMDAARWGGHGFLVQRGEVENWARKGIIQVKAEDLQYVALDDEDQKHSDEVQDEIHQAVRADDADEKRDLWKLYHIYDKVEKKYLLILPGTEKPLIERSDTYGWPYVDFRPAGTPRNYWAHPPAWSYLQVNHTLDDLVETLVSYASRFGKVVMAVGEDEDASILTDFAEAEGAEILQLRNPDLLKFISLESLPQAMLQLVPILNQLITETSGMSEVSSGVVSKGEVTATEIERNVAFQSLRMEDLKDILDASLQRVAQRTAFLLEKAKTQRSLIPLLGLDVEHWQPAEREQLLGEDLGAGDSAELSINPTDLRGPVQFAVRAGESAKEQKLADRKQAMDLLSVLAPLAAQMGMNLLPLIGRILELLGLDPKLVTANASPNPTPEAGAEAQAGAARPGQGPRSTPQNGNKDQQNRTGVPSTANTGAGPTQRI